MSHSSYTASERRGIIAIALIAMIFVAAGLIFTLCERRVQNIQETPIVITYPESVDSGALKVQKEKSSGRTKTKKTSDSKSKNNTKSKVQKTKRKRSPLDEPV